MDIWGTPTGLALVEAYYQEKGFITATTLGERENISDDTARRELNKLVKEGKVVLEMWGRNRFYRAKDELARDSMSQMVKVWSALADHLPLGPEPKTA